MTTTGQQGVQQGEIADPALSAAIDTWHTACHEGVTIEDGMRRVVDAVRAADTPPLAPLVTDEDVQAALDAADLTATPSSVRTMRAVLEAYGARLLGRRQSATDEDDDQDQDRPAPLTAEDGKRIMAEVAAHPRRDVIEALAESMYDLANEDEASGGGGMWHWLNYAHAVVEGVPDLYVAENVPPLDGEPTSDDTTLAPWDLPRP